MFRRRPLWILATAFLATVFLALGSRAQAQTGDQSATLVTVGSEGNLYSETAQCGYLYYPAGWYIVGAPSGATITGATGNLYTFQAGDVTYETVPATSGVKPGYGYWAYFPSDGTGTLPASSRDAVQITLPPNQPVLIGNPFNTDASVSGVDNLTIYQPQTGTYVTTFGLGQGQGAWAFSLKGGQATLRSICPVPP
jgi:hypothetical protein